MEAANAAAEAQLDELLKEMEALLDQQTKAEEAASPMEAAKGQLHRLNRIADRQLSEKEKEKKRARSKMLKVCHAWTELCR